MARVSEPLVLDYRWTYPDRAYRHIDTIGVADICYNMFEGHVLFSSGSADFSAHWDCISLLDFAAALLRAAEAGLRKQRFDFEYTHSDDRISFASRNGDMIISASYAPGTIGLPPKHFRAATQDFARRILIDALGSNPRLRKNKAFVSWFPMPLPKTGASSSS